LFEYNIKYLIIYIIIILFEKGNYNNCSEDVPCLKLNTEFTAADFTNEIPDTRSTNTSLECQVKNEFLI
jgi:hypothetical protein